MAQYAAGDFAARRYFGLRSPRARPVRLKSGAREGDQPLPLNCCLSATMINVARHWWRLDTNINLDEATM
jgi:hypothetical protein